MHWKTRGRLFGAAIIALSFVNANVGYTIGPAIAETSDPVIQYSHGDNAMNAAQLEARSHLGSFLSLVIGPDGLAREDAGVKVAMPLEGGGYEVIWVAPFGRKDGAFVGLLANEPNGLDGLHAGDVITFNEAQVRDWYFFGSDGKMYGSFTTRVMLADMSPTAAAHITDILAPSALPSTW